MHTYLKVVEMKVVHKQRFSVMGLVGGLAVGPGGIGARSGIQPFPGGKLAYRHACGGGKRSKAV